MTLTLTIPARQEFVAVARRVVVEAARLDAQLDAERLEDVRLIVSEAVTNAVQAYRRRRTNLDDADTITLRCVASAGRIDIVVRDAGGGSDVPLDGPIAPPEVTPSATRGYGLPIINALSDELVVRELADGIEIRVVVRGSTSEVQ